MNESTGHKSKPVIACIDGGDDGDRAMRYAIEEAQRRSTGVRLVHISPDPMPYAAMSPGYEVPNLGDLGSHILKDAQERCQALAPELDADATMTTGHRVSGILENTDDAAAIVLGTRKWATSRVFGGSTTTGVAARAACPVIAVPPSWKSEKHFGKVVVGVDPMAEPTPVLIHAFEAARTRGAELTIVHAWTPPHAYAPAFGSFEAHEWQESMEGWLAERTASVRAANQDVPTHLVSTFSVDKAALPELALDADLLVVGRHRHSPPLLHRLGSVAQHAVHAGTSPVEIIPVLEEVSS